MDRKMRKKAHKEVVKYMRALNKNIGNDEYLGINRFRVDMYSEHGYEFDDHSGVELHILFKLTDNVTGNTAIFHCDNFDYRRRLSTCTNDFLIRCSSGWSGHWPHLHYLAYDVHTIVPYAGEAKKGMKRDKFEEGVINTYSWI